MQAQFRAALLDPDAPVPDGLTDGAGRPAGRRFSVYRNDVAGSLTEALRQGFPVLRQLLGQAFFDAMAGAFLRAHPPGSRLMMRYGDRMAAFLAAFPPVAHLPYLPDVARLEQALRESYHAADADPVPAEMLGAMSPDRFLAARLTLAPSVRLIRSVWPIHAIWRANTEADAPAPSMRAETALILRPEYDPVPHGLSAAEGAVAEALLEGDRIADALARAEEIDPGPLVTLLLTSGAVTRVVEA